jgi:serine/threonine protein kinase/Tol biopolymer transport system component
LIRSDRAHATLTVYTSSRLALTPGTRLGIYEVTAQIGEGGMGQVYRATDTKLKRQVAIKILPPALAIEHDRLARFQREAEVLASLNHPNIAGIYGLEEGGGTTALVMELVEGEDLSQRIARGAIPLNEALPIATQIAEALETAHEQGIIHRDLKPANIKVRDDGTVKVLDFGLAKAMDPAGTSSVNAMNSPTLSIHATQAGIILGTAAYMSPEQVRGSAVDKRSDIWAFGCVLYEMLTGRVAFSGKSVSDTIATILTRELDWAALPAATPAHVRKLLQRCLRKDPKQRLHDIADVRIELEESSTAPSDTSSFVGRRKPITLTTAVIVAALMLAVVGALIASRLGGSKSETLPVTHVQISVSPAETLAPGRWIEETATSIALSPDGRTLAFVGRRGTTDQIYIRRLDRREAVALAGTNGASNLFFSTDGRRVGFLAENALKRIAVDGGPPVQLCRVERIVGASWGSDDTIVFGTYGGGLMRVPAAGGTPEELTTLDRAAGEVGHRLPHFVPGAKAVVFTIVRNAFDPRTSQIAVVTVATRARTVLLDDGADGQYVASGHLVFGRLGKLFAVPFDVERLQIRGAPAGILDDVMQSAGGRSATETYAVQVAFSSTGELAYVRGGALPAQDQAVVWVDRKGDVQPLPLPVAEYLSPRLSPDGARVAFDSRGLNRSIWVHDLERGTTTAITQAGSPAYPVWTPDGKRIAFGAGATGPRNLFWISADGSGAPERLATSPFGQWPASWSPDGRTLLFMTYSPETKNDIWALDVSQRPPAARPVIRTPGEDFDPMLSPDGRWLAYTSDESGEAQVYVQPFPALGPKHQVSVNRGVSPTWSRDGQRLFFLDAALFQDAHLFSVDLTLSSTYSASIPRRVLDLPASYLFQSGGVTPNYDVALDGTRFLGIQSRTGPPQAPATEIQLTFNAFAELRARAPAK